MKKNIIFILIILILGLMVIVLESSTSLGMAQQDPGASIAGTAASAGRS